MHCLRAVPAAQDPDAHFWHSRDFYQHGLLILTAIMLSAFQLVRYGGCWCCVDG